MNKQQQKYKKQFEDTYGVGKWKEFVDAVRLRVRPGIIQERFVSKAGNTMAKTMYYKWEGRAWQQIKATEPA